MQGTGAGRTARLWPLAAAAGARAPEKDPPRAMKDDATAQQSVSSATTIC